MRELSFGEVSALCSNLSKGCAKQYRLEEAQLFSQLAEFYRTQSNTEEGQLKDISTIIEQDLASGYTQANIIASNASASLSTLVISFCNGSIVPIVELSQFNVLVLF